MCAMSATRSVSFFGNKCLVVGWIRSLRRDCYCESGLHEQLMDYMEWIPEPCLCMLVGFNDGFTGALSHWLMTEVQRPHNYRVLGSYLNGNHYGRE